MVFRKQTFYPKVFLFNLISIIPFLHQCPSQNTDIYFDFINIYINIQIRICKTNVKLRRKIILNLRRLKNIINI